MSLSALEITIKFMNSQSNRQRCTGGELKRLPLCGQLTASAVCSLEKTGPNSAPYLPDKLEKTYTVELRGVGVLLIIRIVLHTGGGYSPAFPSS